MFDHTVINRMPNVHINRIVVSEMNDLTTISCDIYLLDYALPLARRWYFEKNIARIKINASLVEGVKEIKMISEGLVKLKEKDAISISSSKHTATSTQGEFVKYSYRLNFKVKRKIGSDSSLFFFTSKQIGRSKSNTKKQNHGIYKKSKMTKAQHSMHKFGGVKHIPVFRKGKPISQFHKYMHATDSSEWHGLVKFSNPAQTYIAIIPRETKRPHLKRQKIDNNIMIYNLPTIKKSKKLIAPMRRKQDKKNKKLKKINSVFGRSFKYEMDEEFDRAGNLHKYFVLNLCNLSLSKSIYARKIYNLDRDLFMHISNNLSIGKIKIVRSKFKNMSRVKAQKKTKYKKGRRRYNTKNNKNRKIIASMNNRKATLLKSFFDRDDVAFKRPRKRAISNLEIVDAGLPTEMTAMYFVDRSMHGFGKGKVSYKVELDFDDVFHRYIKMTLKQILNFKNELLKIRRALVEGRAYSRLENKIKGSYVEKFYSKFNFSTTNKDSDALRKSPIVVGLAAVDKAAMLLGRDREEFELDNKINFAKASIGTIRTAISDLGQISTLLQKTYKVVPFFNRTTGIGKSVRSSKAKKRKIIEHSFVLDIDKPVKRDLVSYEFLTFTNELKLNKAAFESRANVEFQKYFSSVPPSVGKGIGDLPANVKDKMLNMSEGRYLYLTPSTINKLKQPLKTSVINKRIKTKDFVEIKDIRKKVLKNKNLRTFNINNISRAPFIIEPENNEKEKDAEDILQIRKFLGNRSPLLNRKLFNKRLVNLKNKKVKSRVSNNTVFQAKSIAKVSKYDFAEDNNALYNDIIENKIDASLIPIQIKSLILNRSPSVKSNYLLNKDDIFQNPKTDEIAYQMYGNIMEVKYIDNFGMTRDGLYDMKRPIIKRMTNTNFQSIQGMSKLCFLNRFDNSMLLKKKDPFRTLSSTFLLTDSGTRPVAPKGMTTHNAGHHHHYDVDENGNGYTTIAYHPENKNIRHRHRVVNYKIQEAKSHCYPKCEDKFGVSGAPPHIHEISSQRFMMKIRQPEQIAMRMIKSMNETELSVAPQPVNVTPAMQPAGQNTAAPAAPAAPAPVVATPVMTTGGGGGGY